jgi:aldehyde oxidoreductase
MEINYLETPRPTGPFGSSGMSEMFLSSNHVSVLNAITDACGVRIREIHATPDKVLAGIQALEKGKVPKQKKYFLGQDFDERIEYLKSHPVKSGEAGVTM